MENVEIEKIPSDVVDSFNEQSIYYSSPPLTIELQEMNNQIILTKLYDDSINIPLGSVLTHFNNKKIQPYNVLEILTQIKKWNKVNNSSSSSMTGTTSLSLPVLEDNTPAQDASLDKNTNTSLILKFRIDVDENESDNLFLSSIHPRRGIFLQELNQKVKTKFGIVLNDDFLIKWCGIYGWDEIMLVSLINHVLEEAKQKIKVVADRNNHGEASHREHEPKKSPQKEIDLSVDKDVMDCIPSSLDNHPNVYTVSLQSRQLGMTVENVLERTIVRSVYPNSEAFRLNVKPNSLILDIGASSTKHQTHLETLEALKNTVRPVRLRLYHIEDKELSKFRAEMQHLVQRQKFNSQETSSILTMVERKLLWVFEIYSFLECIAAGKLLEKHDQLIQSASEDETQEQKSLRIEEAEFCKFNAQLSITRSIKVLEAFELTRQSFLENERREALIHMRCIAIDEAMYDIRELFAWTSSTGYPRVSDVTKQEFQYLSKIIGVMPIDIFLDTIRNLCYTMFLITNDQQPDLQQTFPDRATCDVLDIIIGSTLSKKMLKEQHIPSLWKLAGSSSVQARIACANLVPLVYIHLSTLQRLRIRGLVNRLMVDSIFAVRSYVLSNVCVRILKSIGTKQSGTTYLEEEESITLNWIAHCMIQGSNDNELEVRKSALQICRILVEYSALGSEMNTPENQSLIKELYSYVPDTTPPVTTFPSDSTGGSDSIIIPNVADVHIMFCRALPIISRLVEDKEYQIRSYVGTYCGEFCVLMGGKWSMILLDVIFTCCRDPIMEVRVAGLTSIPHIILAFLQDCIIKQQQLQQQQQTSNPSVDEVVYRPLISIITAVCSMSRDTNQQVKQTLCQILSKLLTLFYSISTNNHTVATTTTTTPSSNILSSIIILENIQSNLSTTMMQLLTDTSPDSKILIEIMIQFSNTLQYEEQSGNTSYLTRIFILENIKILLNSLQILSMNSLWRIRQLICSILPKLIPLICNMENKMIILNIFLKLISDPVFDVRRIACKSLCLCATTSTSSTSVTTPILTSTSSSSSSSSTSNGIFTINWLDEIILPQLETLRTSTIYSNRILALHMISTLLLEDIIHEEDIRCNILINIALTLSNDRVANVRIALCEILYHITPLFEHQQTISSIRIVSPHDDTHDPTSRQPMNINKFYKLDHQLIQLIIQTLEKMVQDRDRDVRYFATKALQNFKKDEER